METILVSFFNQLALWSPRIGGALLIFFFFFFFFANILKKIVLQTTDTIKLDENLAILLARVIRISLIVFGFITALGTLGIDVSALVAGLGLTGFALGFALKDTISNILSGVMVLLYRPFDVGNQIEVSGHMGLVVSINLRYTELVHENNKILIPNSKLFTNPIIVSK
jgi:small conductance mechanosensitive channel